MGLPARQTRREAREDLVVSWGVEQGLLVESSPEFAAYREIIAPRLSRNPDAYKGCVWIERERSVDELLPDDDETGFVDDPRIGQWIQRRSVEPLRALAASWIAGSTDEPEPIGLSDGTRINACAISYQPNERVKWASLDLDLGTIHAAKVISVMRADVGDDALLVHSGSGRKERFRVLLRLEPSCEVQALREHFSRWLAPHGFVYGKDFAVFPSQIHGRAPFGRNGCDWYSLDLSRFTREKPVTLLTAFLGQKPIYLRALASGQKEKVWVIPERKATSKAPKQRLPRKETGAESAERVARRLSGQVESLEASAPKQRLPRRIVAERNPPTPSNVRDLKANGISGPGQRHAALYAFVKDCRYRKLSEDAAIVLVREWIDSGAINASKDANTPSKREQQKRYVAKLVRRVYETHELPGRPEPVALTANEALRVREYAKQVSCASGMTVDAVRALLMGILPVFKGGKLAGLPHVRIHKRDWEAVGGSRVAKLRDACEGLFVPATGYRSAKSLRAKGLSVQNAIENAYATSWKTTFCFDL